MIEYDTLLAQLFERNREIKDLRAQLKATEEVAVDFRDKAESYRMGECAGVIPGTFICCSEGGHYCSSSCMLHAKFKKAVQESNERAKAYEDLKNAVRPNG